MIPDSKRYENAFVCWRGPKCRGLRRKFPDPVKLHTEVTSNNRCQAGEQTTHLLSVKLWRPLAASHRKRVCQECKSATDFAGHTCNDWQGLPSKSFWQPGHKHRKQRPKISASSKTSTECPGQRSCYKAPKCYRTEDSLAKTRKTCFGFLRRL